MKLFLTGILFLVFVFHTAGQQLYFAESYTENGSPIGAKKEWTITAYGCAVYFLFENGGEEIKGNPVYIFIDKEEDGIFQPYDSRALNLDEIKTWLVYEYTFSQPGKYEVYFIDNTQNLLAKGMMTVSPEIYNPGARKIGSNYYDNCKISFYEKVLAGDKPIGQRKNLSLSKGGNSIYVYLDNKAPFNTDVFLVDVWRKKTRAFDYDEFVESKKYRLNSGWPYAYFNYSFKEKGEYKFSIYNQNEVLIKTAYFTVYE